MDKKAKSNLLTRTISGVVLFVIVTGAVLLSRWSFLALLLAICVGCMLEFYRLAEGKGAQPMKIYGICMGVVFIVLNFLFFNYCLPERLLPTLLISLFFSVFITFIAELYRGRENPIFNIAATLTGVVYVALPLASLCYIASSFPLTNPSLISNLSELPNYNSALVLACIYIVWVNDIGAYLVGITLGRHRLFERISPKKSWEGFFGGLLLAVGLAILAAWLADVSVLFWAGAAAVIVVAGVFGDLVESMFKRSAGVKDSGTIMPGHGGWLDRFDALLLAAPFIFLYFIIFASS